MIYGLYLSASGVLTNSYRQDVIANNIANAETVGVKRDLALFQERLTEAQHRRFRGGGMNGQTNDLLESLGGGIAQYLKQCGRVHRRCAEQRVGQARLASEPHIRQVVDRGRFPVFRHQVFVVDEDAGTGRETRPIVFRV